ncbi:hypothetical protein M5689_004973 [Euphorbia peplus]|nr:hypothetical protein M5689_004973 [Euphorbia peplus]
MSLNSCSLFLIFLVCISLHASNARQLAGYDEELHIANMNVEKSVSVATTNVPESSSKMREIDTLEDPLDAHIDYTPGKTHPPVNNRPAAPHELTIFYT